MVRFHFFSFEDGLKLVKLRGEAMQVPIHSWLMVVSISASGMHGVVVTKTNFSP